VLTNNEKVEMLKQHILENKCGSELTNRKLAARFGMPEFSMRRCLKAVGIVKRKMQNASAHNDDQVAKCRGAARHAIHMNHGRTIIIYDESYIQ
jgi:hypothetical protein